MNLFDDGVFYRCGFIIQAEHSRKRHEKCRGTLWHEVVYSSGQVYIVGLVALPDAALDSGQCRFYEFDLQLEWRPHGEPAPLEVRARTPCRLVGKWDW